MARTTWHGSPCRRNSKLETFLKRNTERNVYERIRAYEPCVVISGKINKVFMHVVLSDDCIYLAEFPPRTLRSAVHFRDIVDIVMIRDLPDFLGGREREQSLHVCVVYTSAKDAGKRGLRNRGSALYKFPPSPSPTLRHSGIGPSEEGKSGVCLSTRLAPPEGDDWSMRVPLKRDDGDNGNASCPSRSASCPPCSASCPPVREREAETEGEEREAELHLYALSLSSRIYLHLQSSWNSYIMRSTLMLDPLDMPISSSPPLHRRPKTRTLSWEQNSRLFHQLSAELLQEHLSVESLYLLLQELRTAAHHDAAVRKLFWRSTELYAFLVHLLVENTAICEDSPHTTDRLLFRTLVVQTLGLMFREMELEPARRSMLTSQQGSVTASMLQAVLSDPELLLPDAPPLLHHHITSHEEALRAEYLDAASVLFFEVLVFCQEASHTPDPGHFLSVGWILSILQSHPSLVGFVGYQAQQVALSLSCSRRPLSPSQAVLLYQRCTFLLACVQNSATLWAYVATEFREEFRYYIGLSRLEDQLPSQYPISKPTRHLLGSVLTRLHSPAPTTFPHGA